MEGVRSAFGEELTAVLYEFRRHPRFGLPWDSSTGGGGRVSSVGARDHPLVADLKASRKLCLVEVLNARKVLEPFITIVRSEMANASITAVALSSIERILRCVYAAADREPAHITAVSEAVDDVLEACTECKFEPVDTSKDEIAQCRRLKVCTRAVQLGLHAFVSDFGVVSALELCLQLLFFRRGSELLRREAEECIMSIAHDLCSMVAESGSQSAEYIRGFSSGQLRQALKNLKLSGKSVGEFNFEHTRYEFSMTRPVSPASQRALLLLGALLADPTVGRPVRERMVGMKIIAVCARQLKPDCHPAVREVLINDASLAILRSMGARPPPQPVLLSPTMTCIWALCSVLGSSAAPLLFLLFKSVFIGYLDGSMHGVLREIALEAIGQFASAPGMLTTVYCTCDCNPALPDVAEMFIDALAASVQRAFPLCVNTSAKRLSYPSVSDVVSKNDLRDIGEISIADDDHFDEVDPDVSEVRLEHRAVGIISAKIVVDLVESLALRLKLSSSENHTAADAKRLRESKHQKLSTRPCITAFNDTMQSGSGRRVWELMQKYPPLVLAAECSEARQVAHFLRFTPGLDKAHVGVVLGEPDEFSVEVLAEYTDTFNFEKARFVDAIRVYLESFRLPGESQKIDRIMDSFSKRYFAQTQNNGGLLCSADAAHVLSYAIVMLNTDQHNDSVKRKMTKEEFVKINRGINNDSDLPREFLEEIFDSITEEEIKMSDEAGVAALTQAHWMEYVSSFEASAETRDAGGDAAGTVKFVCATGLDNDVFRLLCNRAIHSSFALLQDAEDTTEAQAALEGFTVIARCATHYRRTSAIDLIAAFLASASTLRSSPLESATLEFGTRIKAQMSAVSLFAVARQAGDWMRLGGWQALISCVLRLHVLGLLPTPFEKLLGSYGSDIVCPNGDAPDASSAVPQWWPSQRDSDASNGQQGDRPKTAAQGRLKAQNGLWSLFGSNSRDGSVGTRSSDSALQHSGAEEPPPAFLNLRGQEEVKARELSRKCISALRVDDVLVGETRFLRSDSLACLCAAISGSVPRILCLLVTKEDGGEATEPYVRGLSTDFTFSLDVSSDESKVRSCMAAFCIGLLTEVTLKNRDRLSVTWPPLFAAISTVMNAGDASSALTERAVAAILKISLRFAHREEIQKEAAELMSMLANLDDSAVCTYANFMAPGLLQLVKVLAVQKSSPNTWRSIVGAIKTLSGAEEKYAIWGLDALGLIVSEALHWCPEAMDGFAELVMSIASFSRLSQSASGTVVDLLQQLSTKPGLICTGGQNLNTNDGRSSARDEVYIKFWKPLAMAFTRAVRESAGPAREKVMLALEQVLSSEACEKSMLPRHWKNLFCTVLIPLLESDFGARQDVERAAVGRTKLRGVMTLSRVFLLQYTKIAESVNMEEFIEMWTGMLHVMQLVAAQDVKDAEDYVPECVKNMVLVMAHSKLLQPGSEPLWSETNRSLKEWMPSIMEHVESIESVR